MRNRSPLGMTAGVAAIMFAATSPVACGARTAETRPQTPASSSVDATDSPQPGARVAGGLPSTPAPSSPCEHPESEDALLSCRQREQERVEAEIAELSQALTQLYGREPELSLAFTNAQAKWLEFRDAECRLRTYDSRDGTAFQSYWLECITELDQTRVEVLQDMKDNP